VGFHNQAEMNEKNEKRLRAIALIFLCAVVPFSLVVVLFAPVSNLISRASLIVTLLAFSFGVYTHYFEPEEIENERLNSDESIYSEAAGLRPEHSAPGFDINAEDINAAQMPPDDLAKVIKNSQNWHPDGNGGYPSWWRPRLREVFNSGTVSNRVLEVAIFSTSAGGLLLFFLVTISDSIFENYHWILQAASEIYPNASPRVNTIVTLFSISLFILGGTYFTVKTRTSCPVCSRPFSLRSCGRYYKPQHRVVEQRIENEEAVNYEIKHGVHIFYCEDCESWSIIPEFWGEKI
jgi:hypothetical protein